MAVITISRGTYSGGKVLAECLSRHLAYSFVDRETIIAGAASCGASEEKLREAIVNPPSFWEHSKEERRRYMILFQALLADRARKDNLIYLGNAGHLLLGGVGHVLRVRIIAPRGYRLKAVQQDLKLSREEALDYLEKRDHDRARWTRYLYDVDWSNPELYDVVLNLERVTPEEACETIALMVRQPTFRTTPEAQAAIDDLALSSRVHAALIVRAETGRLFLEVEAKSGTVTLRGKVRNRRQWLAAEKTAKAVEGVEQLDLSGLVQVLDR